MTSGCFVSTFWAWVDAKLFWKGEALLLLFLVRYLMVSSDFLWNLYLLFKIGKIWQIE